MSPSDGPEQPTAHRLPAVLEGTPAAVAVFDIDLRFRYVNQALADLNGISAAEHIGRTSGEVVPGVDVREDVIRQVLADGVPRETTAVGTLAGTGPRTRYWQAVHHRLEDDGRPWGVMSVALEITASRQQQRELERARARLALLDTASSRIGTTLEMDTTCAELADFLVPRFADVATVEVFPPEEPDAARHVDPARPLTLRRAALAAVPRLRETARRLGEPGRRMRFQPGSRIPACISTGEAVVMQAPTDSELAGAAPHADRVALYREMGLHSALLIPLTARGGSLGALTMARTGDSPPFSEDDLTAALDLGRRAAIALDNARRYTREHGIALELQRALLSDPDAPYSGLEVAARYLPAGASALVGGDWYDTIRRPFGRTLLVMGDVMGHGVEAAVDMSNYRSMLRVVGAADLPPHRILRRMDAMIAESADSRPATCLLVLADPARRTLSYARAGHLPPALLAPSGGARLLQVPAGPPLGSGCGGYTMATADWPPGEVLLMYTDGLVEHRGEDIDVSLDRVTRLHPPADTGLEALVDDVLRTLVREPAEDDVAVMAARPLAPHAA